MVLVMRSHSCRSISRPLSDRTTGLRSNHSRMAVGTCAKRHVVTVLIGVLGKRSECRVRGKSNSGRSFFFK